MTRQEKFRDQVEALTIVLESFMSIVEDIRRTLDEEEGAKKPTIPQRDVTYIVGRRTGLIQRSESLA